MRSKKVIINVISSVLLQLTKVICGFIVPRLIIGSYGSNVNGLISSITQFLYFIVLLEAGFGPVIKATLYKPIAQKDRETICKILKTSEKIFRIIAYLFIAYIIILCCVMPAVVAKEFDVWFTVSLIIIISISNFSEYFFGMTYKLFLHAEQKMYVTSVIQIATLVLNTLVVVLLVRFNASIHIVKLLSSLIFVLRPILQNVYVKQKYKVDLRKIDGNYKFKQKWDALAQHIAWVINSNVDIAIITLCGNLAEVSVYSVYRLIIDGVKSIIKSFVGGIDAAFGDMIAKSESENLNRGFKIYEFFYFSITTIVFSSALFLIVPFVKVYTKGVNDANYITPVLATLMVVEGIVLLIRQPYQDLVNAAGHFKQTQIGAWVEVIFNIVISFVLTYKFGTVGVVIGTIFAMTIRSVEFVCYTSKHILERSIWHSIKVILAIVVEMIIIAMIVSFIPEFKVDGYFTWLLSSIVIVGISTVVVCAINLVIHKESFKDIVSYLKSKRGICR